MSHHPCAICKSPYRGEIERMYLEGYSPKQIAVYIANTYGIKYSVRQVKNHLEKHLEPRRTAETVMEIDKTLNAAENMVKQLNEFEELREIIEDARQLRKKAKDKLMNSEDLKEIEVWAKVWNVAAQRSVAAIKLVLEKSKSEEAKEDILRLLQSMWGAAEEQAS